MKFTILASGSKANCVYIQGNSDALMLDAGLSAREALRRLALAGGDERLIRAVLVTHEHGDHIRGAAPLARMFDAPVMGTAGTLEWFSGSGRTGSIPALKRCTPGERYQVGDFTVEPFATSHDAREPCGYVITEDGAQLCCCTDTGIVTPPLLARMRQSDALILESNHCPDMLKNGPYPEMLKRRIRSKRGHLSNAHASLCLRAIGGEIETVVLAHLSEVNNTQKKAEESAQAALGLFYEREKVSSIPGGDVSPCWTQWYTV
jgi:phosphoribosyl 1,2-cyclic phosphodiesterase